MFVPEISTLASSLTGEREMAKVVVFEALARARASARGRPLLLLAVRDQEQGAARQCILDDLVAQRRRISGK